MMTGILSGNSDSLFNYKPSAEEFCVKVNVDVFMEKFSPPLI